MSEHRDSCPAGPLGPLGGECNCIYRVGDDLGEKSCPVTGEKFTYDDVAAFAELLGTDDDQ